MLWQELRYVNAVIIHLVSSLRMGCWHQRADERHGNAPKVLVVREVGRPPGELGVSKSMECDIFPFSALTLLVG